MTSDDHGTALDRRYRCTSCESIVRARWAETATFFIGCDCTSVPVVPQMTQHETPDEWRVERPECCRGVEVSNLDTIYGERGRDYKCPDCGAEYNWKGEMRGPPDSSDPGRNEDQQRLVTDGGTDAMYGTTQPLPCGVCGEETLPRYLKERRLWDHDSEGYYPAPYDAPVCASCRSKEGLQ